MGPLLFLLYINDLPRNVISQVRLFADDCLLYRPIRCQQDHLTLQEDLDSLCTWANTWGMSFNPSKCYTKKDPPVHFYSMIGCVLSKVETANYLGVTVASNLQWEPNLVLLSKLIGPLGSCAGTWEAALVSYDNLHTSVSWDPSWGMHQPRGIPTLLRI